MPDAEHSGSPTQRLSSLEDGSMSTGQRIGLLETSVLRLADRIDRIESWRDELHGAMALVKFTLGTSIISAALAIITLIALIATGGKTP